MTAVEAISVNSPFKQKSNTSKDTELKKTKHNHSGVIFFFFICTHTDRSVVYFTSTVHRSVT